MNSRTEALTADFKAKLAIVVYSTDDQMGDCYLESHTIDPKGRLLEGKPLKQDTIQGIIDIFFDDRQKKALIGGMIPECLLNFEVLPGGNYKMIWYRPEEKRPIFFSESLHIPSGITWVPPMIYVVDGKALDVFVINEECRPTESTPLFHAPFHNVSSNGSVCLGNAKAKKPEQMTYVNVIQYWETLFWNSEFSHLAGGDNPTKSNLSILWKKLIGTEIKWSDLKDELLPNKKTLKDIL